MVKKGGEVWLHGTTCTWAWCGLAWQQFCLPGRDSHFLQITLSNFWKDHIYSILRATPCKINWFCLNFQHMKILKDCVQIKPHCQVPRTWHCYIAKAVLRIYACFTIYILIALHLFLRPICLFRSFLGFRLKSWFSDKCLASRGAPKARIVHLIQLLTFSSLSHKLP